MNLIRITLIGFSIFWTGAANAAVEWKPFVQPYNQVFPALEISLAMSQANCVDGRVLFASILRKIDIAPALVLIPGHMFLAFQLDQEGED